MCGPFARVRLPVSDLITYSSDFSRYYITVIISPSKWQFTAATACVYCLSTLHSISDTAHCHNISSIVCVVAASADGARFHVLAYVCTCTCLCVCCAFFCAAVNATSAYLAAVVETAPLADILAVPIAPAANDGSGGGSSGGGSAAGLTGAAHTVSMQSITLLGITLHGNNSMRTSLLSLTPRAHARAAADCLAVLPLLCACVWNVVLCPCSALALLYFAF